MNVQVFDLGNSVQCDLCGEHISPDDETSGGLIFLSKACCPYCSEEFEKGIPPDEIKYIRGRCPKDKPFYKWVVEDLRGGKPAIITVTKGNDVLDILDAL